MYASPDAKIADMKCFATSPDQRTVAGAKGRSILFFDVSRAETVNGPFQVSNNLIGDIDQLEFSPDGKFIFFGRLDKWFSVERECVEDFPQFSGKSHIYEWGVFTRDGKSIVVKRDFLSNPATCKAKSCLFNLLALWALKEIEQTKDDEMTVSFFPQVQRHEPGVQIERLLKRLGILNRTRQTPTSFLGASLERERETERERENTGNESEDTPVLHDPSCHYCYRLRELTDSSQESSLVTLRQLVVEFYPFIFNYQVWDLQTGMPLLQQVFSHDIQLNQFTYLCHVTCAMSGYGLKMKCSGIEKALSVCNIAAVSVVCCALFGGFLFGGAFELESELKQKQEQQRVRESVRERLRLCLREQKWLSKLRWRRKRKQKLEQQLEHLRKLKRERQVEQKLELELERELELLREQEQELRVDLELERELELLREQERKLQREQQQELKRERERELELERELGWELERERERERERELLWELWHKLQQTLRQNWELELEWMPELKPKQEVLTEVLQKLALEWKRLVSTGWFREFQDEAFKFGVCTNIPKGFQDLVYDANEEIRIFVSPEMKWIIEAGDSLKLHSFQTGNQDRHFIHHGKPLHAISKFKLFSLTNDDLYLVICYSMDCLLVVY